jgi:hypothetical protein
MSTAKERLAALTKAFDAKTKNEGNTNASWKRFYQFWKMNDDTVATIRFLPDINEDNPLRFLVENLTHELVINGKKKRVPCLSMYGEPCPICAHSSKLYDEKNETLGKKYYKKRSYLGQILVIESPFEEEVKEGEEQHLVRFIDFGPKIFKCIQAGFKSGDLEAEPFEYHEGYNFRIKKEKAGKWSDYGTSNFSPKQTPISDDVILEIKKELVDLSTLREKYVPAATLEAMLLSDITGQALEEKDEGDSGNGEQHQSQAPKSESTSEQQDKSENEAQEQKTEQAPVSNSRQVVEELRARLAAKKANAS